MNKVKSIRTKLGLTQRQLADLVGTSQQQIQRIETGKIAARLALATAIAAALGKSLNAVFPGSEKAIAAIEGGIHASRYLPDAEALDQVGSTGIELDSAEHCLKVWMRGHVEPIFFPLLAHEKRRVFRAVQDESTDSESISFVVFDSADKRVAINLAELFACQFLFEPLVTLDDPDSSKVSEPLNGSEVFVYQSRQQEPIRFVPESDLGDPDDEGDEGYFGNIFQMLETNPAHFERVHFEDEDGESVFLRVGNLALLSVPLWVVDSSLDAESAL